MQYLSYALQTSTRLLSSHSHSQNQSQSQSQTQQEAEQEQEQEQQLLAHACCSRGAQLLRLRQQELAKRRALELEDQLNANAICCEDSAESSETEQQLTTEPEASGDASATGAGATASAQPAQ